MNKIFTRGTTIQLFSLALLTLATSQIFASGCTQPDEATPSPATQPSAGMRAYVDPETGELTDSPPPGEQLDPDQVVDTGPDRPEIEQVVQPDGSVTADIGDRFMTELRVEVVDGEVVTCHRPKEQADTTGGVNDDQQ